MIQQILNYSFNASAKTITFSDYANIQVERIVLVKNLTTNQWIYKITDTAAFGGTVGTNILTFTATNAGMNNTDKLAIRYDAPTSFDTQTVTISGNVPVTGTFWQTTQPVSQSGTWNIGTLSTITNVVHVDDNSGSLTIDGTVAISGTVTVDSELTTANLNTFGGTDIRAVVGLVLAEAAGGILVGSAHPLPISGSVTANIPGAVTVNAGTNLNTSALALESGNLLNIKSNSDALNYIAGTTTFGQRGNMPLGSVTTAAPSYTTGQINYLSLTTAGLLRVDASGTTVPVSGTFWQATQPISGTITASQGGTWNITNISGTVSLPTGAATETTLSSLNTKIPSNLTVTATRLLVDGSGVTQPVSGTFWQATQPVSIAATLAVAQSGTWTVQPGNTANTTAWKVDGSAVTQPVSGTFWQATQPISGSVTISGTATVTGNKAEDAASADGDAGFPMLATRKASPANTSSTDGDYEFLQMSAGRLWTSSVIDTALPAGSNVIGHIVADSGSTTAVTGNVTVIQGTGTNLHTVVDSGTITTITNVVHVDDNSGSLTVDGAVTANAGTNLNTSLLALEAGGNLALIKAKTDNLDVLLSTRLKPADTLAAVTTVTAVTAITNALPSGSNVIGHVIADTGSTTAVTGNVTVVQPTGTNLHIVVDSGTVTANAGTNLNTSLLVLESGGNLATLVAKDFATSAKQDTENTSLSAINTKTPALGLAAVAASTPISIAYDDTMVARQNQTNDLLRLILIEMRTQTILLQSGLNVKEDISILRNDETNDLSIAV